MVTKDAMLKTPERKAPHWGFGAGDNKQTKSAADIAFPEQIVRVLVLGLAIAYTYILLS